MASGSGHSGNPNPAFYNTWSHRSLPPPPPIAPWQQNAREPRWYHHEHYAPDPFVEPYVDPAIRFRGARSSADDVPMPDYVGSSSASSRAISSMTGISYEHSKQPSISASIDQDQYNQLVEALSPSKAFAGTQAPANTPSAAIPMGAKLSAAAEERSRSYSKGGSRRASVMKEIPQSGTRDVSASTMNTDPATEIVIDTGACRLHVSPSPKIKGRKEGSGQENKENEGSVDTPLLENRNSSKNLNLEFSTESKKSRSTRSGSCSSKEDTVNVTPTKRGLSEAGQEKTLENVVDPRMETVAEVADIG